VNAQSRKITLQRVLEVQQVHVDEDLFRRTLTNLVENATRYAPPETCVRITATRLGKEAELRVADEGSGIPPEMRERVFDAFTQIEHGGMSAMRRGRGLGLTFCKRAIEAHGGRIWVEDAGPGAVFCVRWPDGP